jgi:deoxyribose-phosphate aldolase
VTKTWTYTDLSRMIDHALLVPSLTAPQLDDGIRLAKAFDTASVCIMPWYLRRCADLLAGTAVKPCTVIGFPHGGHSAAAKAREAELAIRDGGLELDMVANISAVLSGKWDVVREDLRAVIETAHAVHVNVKVIFENCYLTDDHKVRLCDMCGELRADWVKTSTGFGTGGAVDADLRLMRKHSPAHVQVKASGGIRTLDRLLEVRALGVTRAGASATQAILGDARARLGLPPIADQTVPMAGY